MLNSLVYNMELNGGSGVINSCDLMQSFAEAWLDISVMGLATSNK